VQVNGSPCGSIDTCNVGVWQSCTPYGGCVCSGGPNLPKTVFAYDGDGDGYCVLDTTGPYALQSVCPNASIQPEAPWRPLSSCTSTTQADCDDTRAAVNPGHAEVCINGLDDDCNDSTDEGCVCQPNSVDNTCATKPDNTPITYPGGAPKGECKYGSRTCAADGRSWGVCTGAVAPLPADDCTVPGGKDSTCDGTTACACAPVGAEQLCANQKGACVGSKQSCTGSGWGACSTVPAPQDTCDSGDDASCDGVANNGHPGNTTICQCLNGQSRSCGNCSAGMQTCSAGTWGTCNGAPANVGQNCNYLGKNVGACANGGTWQCDPNAPATPKCVAKHPNIGTNLSSSSPAPNGSFDWSCDGTYQATIRDGQYSSTLACDHIVPNPNGDCQGWMQSYQDQWCDYIPDYATCNSNIWTHTCGTKAQNCFSDQSLVCNVGWSLWRCEWKNDHCSSKTGSYTYSTSTCH
jgi:hypothetical protein